MRRRALLCALLALAFACATAGVQSSRRLVDASELPRPPVMLVHAFAVTPADVVVDTFGPGFASTERRAETGDAVAEALAEALVAELNQRGVRAERADHDTAVPEHAFVLKGQFVTVDEGDRLKRMTIGLGAGRSELRVRVQVYQASADGLLRIAEAEGGAQGDRMPGMALPVGAGAVAGSVARSAVISGGMNVAQEVSGALRPDAQRLARRLAERAATFYQDQGWL